MKRRNIIKAGLLGPFVLPHLVSSESNPFQKGKEGTVEEPRRSLSVVRETDVIVCGGGPAGFAAALASARSGAKTTLIELHGCLGGIWTAGLLSNIIDHENKNGIMKELIYRLDQSGAQFTAKKYDAEQMKWILEEMCREAGVEVRLHTRVTAAYQDRNKKIDFITTESFSGREAWKAKVFIDATGNGDLAARAGCGFDLGEPATGRVQPMSLMVILSGLKEADLVKEGFIEGLGKDGSPSTEGKKKLHAAILRIGFDTSYSMPSFFTIRPDSVALMMNHQYGVSAIDADAISKATIDARNEINKVISGLRATGGIWSNVRIVTSAAQIGIREGRRIHGQYMLTKEDLLKGAQFPDGVCDVKFSVDVHALAKAEGGGYSNSGIKMKPYQIPLRSLIAKDVTNLMMAGRCISGDFYAHASYRVTGNAVPMGEAAGKVAAKASLSNRLPMAVNWSEVS
ncbi:Thiamine thiazole synthase [Dyadobacter sp. CECT 9275]|uniref:Thiamine thiazole synthase n=1 Tax=Dyadobacter helix TaxID=2822344 RepID=A0A916JD19_9BACT|nr:FAD-dependent oxidoreductase [Dyadobacter sp. CECT 9275]CAG5002514.1 Thiamine thiazole synthase [Dyadobacter sp. CECT 9275]